MAKVETTQLLVAGGGPVGLFAALCAARRGLDVMVIERSFRGTPRGHTTLLHPSSLRMLQELGLSPLLLRTGQLIEEIQLRVGSNGQRLKLPYPALAITQSLFEETLLKALRSAEVDVRATCEVTALRQDAQCVEVEAVRREQVKASSRPELEEWEVVDATSVRAPFVIGADGRQSRLRELLGIGSVSAGIERFAMFEFPRSFSFDTQLIVLDSHIHAVAPLADARARCSFQLDLESKPAPDLTLLNALLAERAPWFQERPAEVDWSSVVDFEPAVADVWGRGRVWLAGDAAHTASPLGVQSMNRGLTEAFALVDEISSLPVGGRVEQLAQLASSQRQSWLSELGNDARFDLLPHAPSWLPGHTKRLAAALPVSGADLEELLRQLGIKRREAA